MEQRFIAIFLFVFVFLGAFITLAALIPPQLVWSSKEYANPDYPEGETWQALYLQASNSTKQITVNATALGYGPFDLGGRNLNLYRRNEVFHYVLALQHKYGFGLFGTENMDWTNQNGINEGGEMQDYMFDDDYAEFGALKYIVTSLGLAGGPLFGYSSKFHIEVQLSFNTTLYDTPTEAWAASDLRMFLGIDFDQTNTALNAWDMIARLLTFQKVEIFGNGPDADAVNRIFGYAFWACIVGLAFVVIVELIPF